MTTANEPTANEPTTNEPHGPPLILERTLRYSPARVWKMFTTKAGLEAWWGPQGFRSECTHLDVRVGGSFQIVMTAVRDDIVAYLKGAGIPVSSNDGGDYTAVKEAHTIAWGKGVDFVPGVATYQSETTVTLTAVDGGTHLRLVTSAMHDAHWNKMKRMGWEEQLDKLVNLSLADS